MAEHRAGSSINKPVARLGIAIFDRERSDVHDGAVEQRRLCHCAVGRRVAPAAVAAPIIGDRLDDVIRWLVLVLRRR